MKSSMVESGVAVKAFIFDKNENVLILKRSLSDSYEPDAWEVPGGRLKQGEDPLLGLLRETKEESNLDIEIVCPLNTHHFTRSDGQVITMISYFCKANSFDVVISDEHSEYEWCSVDQAYGKVFPAFKTDLDNFKKFFSRQG